MLYLDKPGLGGPPHRRATFWRPSFFEGLDYALLTLLRTYYMYESKDVMFLGDL